MSAIRKFISSIRGRLPDPILVRLIHLWYYKRLPNLRNPRRMSDLLARAKLTRDHRELALYADKLAVRDYVADKLGEEHLIPLLGVFESADKVPWDELPTAVVLKATHGSAMTQLVHDSRTIDRKAVTAKLARWLSTDISKRFCEPHYRYITPRIIAEQPIFVNGAAPADFKFYVFSGKVRFFYLVDGRHGNSETRTFYSPDGQRLRVARVGAGPASEPEVLPENLDVMIQFAEKLAPQFDFVRVDLYSVEGQIYFGELTFYPGGGVQHFVPEEFDQVAGSLWLHPGELGSEWIQPV